MSMMMNHSNLMIREVMLSHPRPDMVSLASNSSNSNSSIFSLEYLLAMWLRTISMRPWLFYTYFSQIPSQPTMMNQSPSLRQYSRMSGLQVIICSSQPKSLFFLQSKSPKERVRFSPPLTRPMYTTPPAFLIRFSSSSLSGLWSKERSIALPPRHSTLRESPALATMYLVGVMRTTLAVHPVFLEMGSLTSTLSCWLSVLVASSLRMLSSMSLKASSRASTYFSQPQDLQEFSSSVNFSATYLLTQWP